MCLVHSMFNAHDSELSQELCSRSFRKFVGVSYNLRLSFTSGFGGGQALECGGLECIQLFHYMVICNFSPDRKIEAVCLCIGFCTVPSSQEFQAWIFQEGYLRTSSFV